MGLLLFIALKFFITFIYWRWAQVYHGMYVVVRLQLGVPVLSFYHMGPGHQVWQQVTEPTEPSCWPLLN